MIRTLLLSVAVTHVLGAGGAGAQPDDAVIYQPAVVDKDDLPVRKKSYFVPAAEILIGNLSLSVVMYFRGFDWAARSSDGWIDQLDTPWIWDEDKYTVNQLAHPFMGSLSYSAARSTGHEFWVASGYAIASSLLWEGVIENDLPSKNDMITTPIGGIFIGEALHRFGRALLYRGYGKPTWSRKAAASIIDPVGAINRSWWGDAWAKTIPPNLYAHFGVGYQQPTKVMGNRGGDGEFHVEAFVEHGLLGDRSFEPKRPLDHFELYADVNAGNDSLEGDLYVRGVLVGGKLWRDDVRVMYGLLGAYDWNNNDYVRASALGIGPGGTAEVELGERGYLAGTLAAYGVPYGAAGGYREVEGPMRDSHDGPGLAQLFELKGGQRGRFAVKLTTRAYEIGGTLVGDDADEVVLQGTLGGRIQLRAHHAIGIEATHTYERASFSDPMMTAPANRTTDFRAFYAITTDEILGR
jgi:hypothetical protein